MLDALWKRKMNLGHYLCSDFCPFSGVEKALLHAYSTNRLGKSVFRKGRIELPGGRGGKTSTYGFDIINLKWLSEYFDVWTRS
jgi:hypothetical protein